MHGDPRKTIKQFQMTGLHNVCLPPTSDWYKDGHGCKEQQQNPGSPH